MGGWHRFMMIIWEVLNIGDPPKWMVHWLIQWLEIMVLGQIGAGLVNCCGVVFCETGRFQQGKPQY